MRLQRRYGARLVVEHEDALAELVGEAWRLHRDWWDPNRNPSLASARSWKLGCFGRPLPAATTRPQRREPAPALLAASVVSFGNAARKGRRAWIGALSVRAAS